MAALRRAAPCGCKRFQAGAVHGTPNQAAYPPPPLATTHARTPLHTHTCAPGRTCPSIAAPHAAPAAAAPAAPPGTPLRRSEQTSSRRHTSGTTAKAGRCRYWRPLWACRSCRPHWPRTLAAVRPSVPTCEPGVALHPPAPPARPLPLRRRLLKGLARVLVAPAEAGQPPGSRHAAQGAALLPSPCCQEHPSSISQSLMRVPPPRCTPERRLEPLPAAVHLPLGAAGAAAHLLACRPQVVDQGL